MTSTFDVILKWHRQLQLHLFIKFKLAILDLEAKSSDGQTDEVLFISLNGNSIPWVTKVKYLGIQLLCNTGIIDVSDVCRRFYGQFNNIMSVLGKQSNEMSAVHLVKTYCLPTLMYGCEAWTLTDGSLHKLNTAWNNCFRRIFLCYWREGTRPSQFFCKSLPFYLLLDQRKLILWMKIRRLNNVVL